MFRCAVVTGALLVSIFLATATFWERTTPTIPAHLQGMGGDFLLRSADGPLALHELRGNAVLLYFGYGHCPDACPQALSRIARVMRAMPVVMRSRVAGVFVSLDPRRDTLEFLKRYSAFFHERITGVTGTPQMLEKVAYRWRVDYAVPDMPPTSDYAVSHSEFICLIDPRGRLVAIFGTRTSVAAMVGVIRCWLTNLGDD